MLRKAIIDGPVVESWIVGKLGRNLCKPCVAIGIMIDHEIVGAALFNNWTGPNIYVTVAGEPRAWSRAFLRRLAHYAFEEIGCIRVTLTTEQPEVADLCVRLGGYHEGTMVNAFGPGRDGLLFGIQRADWRI